MRHEGHLPAVREPHSRRRVDVLRVWRSHLPEGRCGVNEADEFKLKVTRRALEGYRSFQANPDHTVTLSPSVLADLVNAAEWLEELLTAGEE